MIPKNLLTITGYQTLKVYGEEKERQTQGS